MLKYKKKTILSVIFILLFLLGASETFSESQSPEGRIILAVRVKGNQSISTPAILAKIKTAPGVPFSQEITNDDIKRLYALGYFTDVAIDVEDYEEGVMVTIIVEEKPVVSSVIFEGNKKMRAGRIKKIMQTREGGMLKFSKLSEDISEIKMLYEKNGFSRINVKYELKKKKDTNEVEVKIIIDEHRRMRIKKVTLEGNKLVKKNKLLEIMETRPAWFFMRGYFDDQKFENDLLRIKMYYQDIGFLDVGVTPSFDYDEEKGLMYITIKIDEGPEYTVGNITINGNLVLPENEVKEFITLKEGDIFSYSKLRENIASMRSFYYQKGYMNAEILVDRVLQPGTTKMDFIFDINGKEPVYIGMINVKGNTKTKDIVIRRELRAYPGDRFDGNKIRRSKERLYNLGFFEDIYFETVPTANPNVNNLDVHVKETKTGEFAFGGGYSSVDQFIGFVQVMQKNFDILNFPKFTGDGQNLILRAEGGMVRWNFDLSWTEPWILDYPLSFGFDVYQRTHFKETRVGYGYKESKTGGDLRLGKEFLEYFNTTLMYRLDHVDISDISDEATGGLKDEEGQNWLSSLIFGLNFDNRDSVYSPTKGFVTGISLENTGGFLMGDRSYAKGFFFGSFYYSPVNKVVIEFKARTGVGSGYGKTERIPIYDRYYAGGGTTIRGYEERRVGPRDPSTNDPLGGEIMVIGNVELTFPIWEKVIKGAVFYDVGNVWKTMEDFGQGGYKQGTGVGVRMKTPIGPIKLDLGWPLTRNYDDKREPQLYFSASHGF